ncbi:MAG TPA: hypothetical protein VK979_04205, partial [Guyparkeria sp.]|nr:hypothetical protein [Guyparkeria sp.]
PYRVIDQEVTLWIASLHLRPYNGKRKGVDSRRDVDVIVIPNYRTSGVTLGERRFDRAWEMFELMVRREITPVQPFYKYAKAEVLQDMPPELFEMCWWCRSPKAGKPCGRCKQCRNVNASGRLR